MSTLAEIYKINAKIMRQEVFLWFAVIALVCGLGASVHFLDGWVEIAALVGIAVVLAFVCALADYKTRNADSNNQSRIRILYIATAVVATWPLLACVMINYHGLVAVSVTTISLIGISIRRALENG